MDDGANDSCDLLCCIHRHVCTTVLGTSPSHRRCTGVCEWDDEMLSYSLKRASSDAEATRDEEGGCHDYVMGVGHHTKGSDVDTSRLADFGHQQLLHVTIPGIFLHHVSCHQPRHHDGVMCPASPQHSLRLAGPLHLAASMKTSPKQAHSTN